VHQRERPRRSVTADQTAPCRRKGRSLRSRCEAKRSSFDRAWRGRLQVAKDESGYRQRSLPLEPFADRRTLNGVNMARGVEGEQTHVSRWMRLQGAALVAVLLLGACSAPGGSANDPAAAARGPKLSVSEQTVHVGDVIELQVEASRNDTWGVQTSLEESRDGKRETIYYWSTWAGKESRINEPFPADEATVFPLIGFQGEGSFKIRVPDVAPGEYRITKSFSSGPKGRDTRSEIEIRVVP
jgi:hypothetical protein